MKQMASGKPLCAQGAQLGARDDPEQWAGGSGGDSRGRRYV